MKKQSTLAIAAVCASLLLGCGGNDGDDNAKSAPGVLDESTGLRIKEAEDYQYTYDKTGCLSTIKPVYDRAIQFSTDTKNTLTYDGIKATFDQDKNGFMSSIHFETGVTVTFSYGRNGHLKSIIQKNAYGSATASFTWSEDTLTKVELSNSVSIDKYTYIPEYGNNENQNRYYQWGPCFSDIMDNTFYEGLAYGNMLGKGPSPLPSGMKEEWYENGKNKTYSDSYKYKFNPDGSISSTYNGTYRWYYSYDFVNLNNKDQSNL
ncbi:MAG: hypothetical protein IJ243_07995 [Prevotella sp.]|nr:hypothetical protein [Prevotella sp.]